jgi:hypothetical protein
LDGVHLHEYLAKQHSMIELFQRTIAWLMNRVRVNQVRQSVQDGIPIFVKRRRRGASFAIWLGNLFLRQAQSESRMFVRSREWLDWEVHCIRLLYPEWLGVRVGPAQSLCIPKVSGASLRHLLHAGDLGVSAFILAARELRRVHHIQCHRQQAKWSHGDLHLDNIICDLVAQRAVLIDFDTRHDLRLSQTQRQADDLQLVLLELIGHPQDNWIPQATAVVEEYGDSSVLDELARQLFVPSGFAKILWYTRTNCSPLRRIEPRLQILREIVHRYSSTAIHPSCTELSPRASSEKTA